MRKPLVIGALAALGVGGHALAAEGISYSNAELGFFQGDMGNIDSGEGIIDADGDGFSIAGSAEFGDMLFGFVSFSSLDLDDIDLDDVDVDGKVKVKPLSLGVGIHVPLGASAVDFVGGVSYERFKFSVSDGVDSISFSDSGYGVSAGLRGKVGDKLELHGTLKYVDLGSSELVYGVAGRYYFTDSFAVGLDYSKYDDSDLSLLGLSLRYDFAGM